jgi:hypothetical protein
MAALGRGVRGAGQLAVQPCRNVRNIAVAWIVSTWRDSQDTRWAVSALARLGEENPDSHMGLFIGLDDEWEAGWGRSEPDLETAAENGLDALLLELPRATMTVRAASNTALAGDLLERGPSARHAPRSG